MEPTESIRADVEILRRAVQVILAPAWERGDIVELRALGTRKGVCSGYFDAEHSEHLVSFAARLSGVADGIYITLNPVMRDCLARAANRAIPYAKHTTGDSEITHRHWLLIDTDPIRPSGISANDEEHNAALNRAVAIRSWLREQGWPDPIYADSGNGGHLLYRVDLPPDDEGLVQRVLKALGDKYTDKAVEVDLKVHNSARISKLYGTLACKGDSVPERPHRIARLLEVPEQIEPVARELLEAVASMSQTATASAKAVHSDNGKATPDKQGFDVVEYLQSHGITLGRSKPYADGGTLWELAHCPWQADKSGGGAFVIQFGDGGITAGCHHPQCDGKGWDELRDLIDPGWKKRSETKGSKKGASVAQQCITLAAADELFHTPDQEAYASIRRDNHRETWRVRSKPYKLILRARLYGRGIVANDSALDDAVSTLESKALFEGPVRSVHVRTAQSDGKLYIDLCNDAWETVEVSEDGWTVLPDSPVKFIRKEGMLPLPEPAKGGSIEQLRPFINVTDDDWKLLVAWLMAAIRSTGPYPILVVNGEHGSCKSTTCRRLRSLVDPNTVPIRKSPKDDQTLMIWATNSHVVALDNLSSMSTWLSDAMCRLATGGGNSERALYSDDCEKLFFAIRPQMVNGIGDIANRSDFLDRALIVNSPVVPKPARKPEKELDEGFAAVYAPIFGAILTAASHGLKHLPEIERANHDLPRLADFAKWMMAVESALGWQPGDFMRAITRNEDESHETVVAGSAFASTVRKFVLGKQHWNGSWEELRTALDGFADEGIKRQESWPRNNHAVSTKLRESAPNLRGVGIDVQFHDKERPKRVTLVNMAVSSQPAAGAGDATPSMAPGYVSKPARASFGTSDMAPEYRSRPVLASFDSGRRPDQAFYEKLWRFWTAPPLAAPVALPTQTLDLCDGAEVSCG